MLPMSHPGFSQSLRFAPFSYHFCLGCRFSLLLKCKRKDVQTQACCYSVRVRGRPLYFSQWANTTYNSSHGRGTKKKKKKTSLAWWHLCARTFCSLTDLLPFFPQIKQNITYVQLFTRLDFQHQPVFVRQTDWHWLVGPSWPGRALRVIAEEFDYNICIYFLKNCSFF